MTLTKEIIINLLKKNPSSIAILTHDIPDGDGLCVCLALKKILKTYNFETDIILEKTPKDKFDFLQAKENCLTISKAQTYYETILLIDASVINRFSYSQNIIKKAKNIIIIDHHQTKKSALNTPYSLIEPKAACTGILLHNLFFEDILKLNDLNLKKYYANCIYTSILNDTNGFANANTDQKVFEVCLDLAKLNINFSEIYNIILHNKTLNELKFISETLLTSKLYHNYINIAFSNKEMYEKYNFDLNSTPKVLPTLVQSQEAKLFIYIKEKTPLLAKVSFRSNYFNVNELAKYFQGGGHKNAAGCEIAGNIAQVKEKILAYLEEINHEL